MVYIRRSASSESNEDRDIDPSARSSPYPALTTFAIGSSSASSSVALRPLPSAGATFYTEECPGSNEAHAQRFSTTVRFANDSGTNEFQRALFSINRLPENRTNYQSYAQRPMYARAPPPPPPPPQQQQPWGYHEEEEVKSSVWDGQQEEVAAINERRRAAPVFSFFVPPISIPSATTASSVSSAGPEPRQQIPTPRIRPITNASRDITFNMLRPHFNRPLQEAAQHFGVCTTLLKKICRKNGIARWPYRHICGLHKSIASLKQQVQYFDGKEKKSYAEQLRKLEIDLESHQQTGTEPTQDFIESLSEEQTQSASIANEFEDEEEKSETHVHATDVIDQGELEFRGPSTAHDAPVDFAVNWRLDASLAAQNNQLQEGNPYKAAPRTTASATPVASLASHPSLPSLSSLLNRPSPRHQDEFY